MGVLAATVRDNETAHRYELEHEGKLVGELVYRANAEVVTLIHTEIASGFEGRGLGEQLVAGALDDIRARGLRIVPFCPFVAAYLQRHPEYERLIASRGVR
jgi:predicted GNAT family acetyltransferase